MKLKDNTFYNSEESEKLKRNIPELIKKVSNKTLEQLEKEGIFIFPELINSSEDLSKDQIILEEINNSFRTSNIMGFLGIGDEILSIESRFSNGDNDFFFQYLIKKALNLPNILDLDTTTNQENRSYNLLLFLFPYFLKKAMRKGIYKTYITHHYNDSNLRGTVDIARHIKQNTPFIGNIAYNQREFTPNNELIKLIRHTIEFINTKNFGKKLLKNSGDQTEQIIMSTPDYELNDRQKIIYKNKINPIRHAYFHEYRQLQQLCIMILEHQKHQIGKGNRHIHGVLFDGSWLWEEYINTLIKDDFIHPMNKADQGGQFLFNNGSGKIYPDFISSNPNHRIIADAKYKPESNIGNKDYLQVVAYMYRFDSKKGYYIYPESNDKKPEIFHLLQGVKGIDKNIVPRADVTLTKLGLKIPNVSDSYNEFKAEIQKNEVVFKRTIEFSPEKLAVS